MILKINASFPDMAKLRAAVWRRDVVQAPCHRRPALTERRKAVLGDDYCDGRAEGPRVDLKVKAGRRWRIVKASIGWAADEPVLVLGRDPGYEYDDRDRDWEDLS